MTLAALVVYLTALVAVSIVDLRERRIPNVVVLPAAAAVLALRTAADPTPEWALAAFGVALFLFVAALIRPEGLGMGDVKLALLLGAMLGRDVALAIVIGFAAASVVGLALMPWRGRKSTLPLAPFLAVGGIAALFLRGAV